MLFPYALLILGSLIRFASARSPDGTDLSDWRRLAHPGASYWNADDNEAIDSEDANNTDTRNRFGKRAADPNLVAKGLALACLMSNTQSGANQYAASNPWLANLGGNVASQWTDPAALEANSWYNKDTPNNVIALLFGTQAARAQFGGSATNNAQFAGVIDKWNSPRFTDQNGKSQQIGGDYENVYGWSSGIILADDNHSPKADAISWGISPASFAPVLANVPNAWSDVVFLRWTIVCSSQSTAENEYSVNSLQHVFRMAILNTPTQSAIVAAVGDGAASATSWANRITFTPAPAGGPISDNNNNFYALLATPNVAGVCWMLIQHKAQLGLKYVDSISVWKSSGLWNLYAHISTYVPPPPPPAARL